jgi:transcription initiation factor TFIID subunit 15
MGDIPSNTQMVSAVMVSPKDGDVLAANSNITFAVQIENLVAGSFTNPDITYYAAPQALSGGKVVGHTHITVQDLGKDFFPQTPLDPTVFSFFQGINDAGNGNGLLSATLKGGLPEGFYRVCSMTSASNHQPVLMPVAQRGAQDDCAKFQVAAAEGTNLILCGLNPNTAGCGGSTAGGNGGNGGNANAASSTAAVAQTSATAAQSTATAGGKTGQNGKGGKFGAGKQGQRFGRPRKFSAREWIA